MASENSAASVVEASTALRAQLDSASVEQLAAWVRHHNARYWEKNAPEIDDSTYDKLVEALRARDPQHAALDELGERAPAAPQPELFAGVGRASFPPVKHARPMLSLQKCYTDEELLKWAADIKGELIVTPKIDGLACSLLYTNGKLVRAATRGDGTTGDDITQNAKGVVDIPHALGDGTVNVEVRGEVYMRLSRFNALYKADKANPRNLAAGALKMKDPAESKSYGLTFYAYDLLGMSGVSTEEEKVARLKGFGFHTLPVQLAQSKDDIVTAYRAIAELGRGLDTEIDGVVIKANRTSEQERLGATSHHPRAAIAYKFESEGALTTIRSVEWGVARSGAVTPVALVEPIPLKGVTVSRVSLHNAGYARKLGAGPGAQVEVVRSGDVIPYVTRVITPPTAPLVFPTSWPVHDGETPVILDGDFLYLQEPERSHEVVADRVRHFTTTIDATGFGEKILAQLVESGLARTPADLYRLDVDRLAALDRMGETSARNLVAMMAARKELTLPVLLTALGIDRLGKSVAERLAQTFHTLPAVRAADEAALVQIDGIGPAIAAAIVRGLKESEAVLDALLDVVRVVEPAKVEDTGHPLFGKSVVFTGTMATLDRKSAQKRVNALGGKTPSSVTADLDYLVIGDEGSSLLSGGEKSTKEKAAEKLKAKGAPVQIISETAFLALLG